MKILVDMNLTPGWIPVLAEEGIEAVHWSEVGAANAQDFEILSYARDENFVVFTHDFDFGDILAATGANAPSVIQIRTADTTPEAVKSLLFKSLTRFKIRLEEGALITINSKKMRARILPL